MLFLFFFFLREGVEILSLPLLPGMTVIIREGLYLSVVPEVYGTKLGGIVYGVQEMGFKAET